MRYTTKASRTGFTLSSSATAWMTTTKTTEIRVGARLTPESRHRPDTMPNDREWIIGRTN